MNRTRAIAIAVAALIYVLFPIDLVPDFWPLVGWLDDLLAVGLAGYLLVNGWSGRPNPAEAPRVPPPPSPEPSDTEDPYLVLGVERGADAEQIRQAYRARMAEYHPDKVAHLGAELQKLAARKTLAIQRAYERLAG